MLERVSFSGQKKRRKEKTDLKTVSRVGNLLDDMEERTGMN
jgi:hypothetical protein